MEGNEETKNNNRSNRNYQDVFFVYSWMSRMTVQKKPLCNASPHYSFSRICILSRCWALLFYTAEFNFVFLSRYTNYCCFLCPAILLPSVNLQWNFWPSRTSLETFFRVPSEYMNSLMSKFTVLTGNEIRLNNPAQIRRIYTIYI